MTLELSAQAIMTGIAEANITVEVTEAEPVQLMPDQIMTQNGDLDDISERIENLERINMDLLTLLKEKAVREAYLEGKINKILKYVERTEQLLEERSNFMLEETRNQIAAAQQKKWWQWWK
jgi:chromosome segregation ATPase